MARLNFRQRAQRAQVAIDGLRIGALTQADQERCHQALDGLVALDDEQSELKANIEWLCNEYWNPNAPDDECASLVRALKQLLVPKRGWRERPTLPQASKGEP